MRRSRVNFAAPRVNLPIALAIMLALVFGSQALANPALAETVGDGPVWNPRFSFSFDSDDIAQARRSAARDKRMGRQSEEMSRLESALERSAAEDGQTLIDGDVDAFSLNSTVAVAVAKGESLSGVRVASTTEGKVVAEAYSETTALFPEAQTEQGHGMGWSYQRAGVYIIKISGVGEMESQYKKYGFEGSGPDLSSMRRKALGRAYSISGIDYSVTGLYISSHVKDADKWKVRYRWDSKPSSDFNGNCDNNTYGLSLKGLGWSFNDCDHYDISWDASNPGYYRNYMTQGSVFHRGDREVAFHYVVAVKDGRNNLSYTHYQRLEMARWVYPATKCSSWSSGNTC